MTANEIFEKMKNEFGDVIIEFKDEVHSDPFIVVEASKIFDICHTLRDDNDFLFDYLSCLSGLDKKDDLQVVYHLYSMTHRHTIVIKASVPKENPNIPSVERIWKAADWHEREAYDMLGIIFDGHHNLIRILTPYDWEGYPLRKDYKEPEYYNGIKVSY
jgi:NADH-quinone oxidoreductase subunit C